MATILLPKTPFVDAKGRVAHEWFIFLTQLLDGSLGGTVTEVLGGAGITITDGTTTPSVALTETGVVPGPYTSTNLTVDAYGRITVAANGSTLPSIANNTLLANTSGVAALPISTTVSALLDAALGSTQGQIITRNAVTWTVLNPGPATYVLTSGGAGANLAWAAAAGGSSFGYTSKSADYTLVLADANQGYLHPSTDANARTFTIPANASVAFAVGTYIVFVNGNNGANLSIAITTDTMRLAGSGTTGTRTLAPNGVCTATKIASTEWLISGTGLT